MKTETKRDLKREYRLLLSAIWGQHIWPNLKHYSSIFWAIITHPKMWKYLLSALGISLAIASPFATYHLLTNHLPQLTLVQAIIFGVGIIISWIVILICTIILLSRDFDGEKYITIPVIYLVSSIIIFVWNYESYTFEDDKLIVLNSEIITPINKNKKYVWLKKSETTEYEHFKGDINTIITITTKIERLFSVSPEDAINHEEMKLFIGYTWDADDLLEMAGGDYLEITQTALENALENATDTLNQSYPIDAFQLDESTKAKLTNDLTLNLASLTCANLNKEGYIHCPTLNVQVYF